MSNATADRIAPFGGAAPSTPSTPSTMTPDAPKVSLRGLHKAFGERKVLRGLDLDVGAAESVVIIGGSGSGKSVLLKHIIGLLRPDAGTVLIDDVDIQQLNQRDLTVFRRRFGMAFQEGALFDSMTVGDNVGFALKRLSDLSRAEIRQRVDECLAQVHLFDVADRFPSQLSGGMRRRVGFARAIAHRPEIILFDEPTTGLDPVTTAVVDELIIDLGQSIGATSITITHDMKSAFRIADRIGMLYEGQIIALSPPSEFRALDDPRIQQFIEGRADGPLTEG